MAQLNREFHKAFGRIRTLLVTSTATGASTRELMARMGHASSRAALIYQHATRDRDAAIAAALSDLVTGATESSRPAVVPLLRRER